MAKMTIKGLDELISNLEKLGRDPEGIVKMALYEGAGRMADAIRAGVNGIPVNEGKGRNRSGITSSEKQGLLDGIGISKMRSEDGQVTAVIGFAGTNSDGHRNTTIMRRLESGTSYQAKYPVVRPAMNRTKTSVADAMQKTIVEETKKIMEGN